MRLRSLLFIPGHRARFYEKLPDFAPDGVILDLEDAVPPAEKPLARQMARERLGGPLLADYRAFVRVNAIGTEFFEDDVRGVVAPGLAGIFLPKVETADQLRGANMVLAQAELRAGLPLGTTRLVPIMETVRGVLDARELAKASPRILALAFGAEDFTRDLGVSRTPSGLETRYPRAYVALAAHSAGIQAFDTPWASIGDRDGMVRETTEAKQLGYQGKQAIHPSQVQIIHDVFALPAEDVERARRIVSAYDEATACGTGAINLDGELIDVPMVARARRFLEQSRDE